VRLAAISDLHGFLPETPPCDVLVIAGDVCPVADHSLPFQHEWVANVFAPWLRRQPAAAIIGIAGNHDFVAEADEELMRSLPWTYLLDEPTEAGNLTLYGSPWTPTYGAWAFMRDDEELAATWARIPDETDVVVTHGPQLGHGDLIVNGNRGGSETLRRRLEELTALRLHVFGHIHEAGGSRTRVGGADVVNVSHVDFDYRPVRPATMFEL
jgi:Icc-related predicted phosphoesterase